MSLIPEKLEQYHLDMMTVAQLVGAASYTMPGGSTGVGNTELSISSGVNIPPLRLWRTPITIGGGNIIYLKDIAEVSRAQEDATAIGRFDGNDTIILSLSRNQKYTAVDVSRQATQVMEELEAEKSQYRAESHKRQRRSDHKLS